MYSDDLNKRKIKGEDGKPPRTIEETMELIDGFCTKDDVLFVPQKELFELFDEYCRENGYGVVSHKAAGRAFSTKFGLGSRTIRNGGEVVRVYVSEKSKTDGTKEKTLRVIELLDGFCKKEDVIGVPQKKIFDLFDRYCKENGHEIMSHRAIGRAIRKKFDLDGASIRHNGEVVRIYVEKR